LAPAIPTVTLYSHALNLFSRACCIPHLSNPSNIRRD
jgi:hypothetical protein